MIETGFLKKLKGTTKSPPRANISEIIRSFVGGFLGVGSVSYIHYNIIRDSSATVMLIASFAASAVLIYGASRSPLAQPRNLIGGHMLSALIGVLSYKLFSNHMWLAASLAASTSIAVMHLTKTLHPPGGATALTAVIGGKKIYDLGFMYVLVPVTLGVLVMLGIALIINNIKTVHRYPEYWL